jgi:hypothetical protein
MTGTQTTPSGGRWLNRRWLHHLYAGADHCIRPRLSVAFDHVGRPHLTFPAVLMAIGDADGRTGIRCRPESSRGPPLRRDATG